MKGKRELSRQSWRLRVVFDASAEIFRWVTVRGLFSRRATSPKKFPRPVREFRRLFLGIFSWAERNEEVEGVCRFEAKEVDGRIFSRIGLGGLQWGGGGMQGAWAGEGAGSLRS